MKNWLDNIGAASSYMKNFHTLESGGFVHDVHNASVKDKIVPSEALKTFDFGSLEGEKQTEALNKEIHHNIINNPDGPMAKEGETFSQATNRVVPKMKELIENAPANTAVVTHNSIYGLIKLWDKENRPDSFDKDQREKYTKQDNSFDTGEHFTIQGKNGPIYIARHGKTEDNKKGLFRRPSTPLTKEGIAEAKSLGKTLSKHSISQVITSPLDRTLQTSGLILKEQEGEKKNIARSGAFLDNYGEEENANEGFSRGPSDMITTGVTNKGFNYNGAWGGQFKNGGWLDSMQNGGYAKNTFLNRIVNRKNILENQILQENPALKDVAPLRKFHVEYANPEDEKTLKQLHHNPEYISPEEGTEDYYTKGRNELVKRGRMQVSSDDEPLQTVGVKHPGHYTTMINPNDLRGMSVKDASALDFIGHALHSQKPYQDLSDRLRQGLETKYGPEHIEQEGGTDAYVRGIFSGENQEYAPYREELQGVDPELIQQMRNYVKGTKFAMGGSMPGSVGFTYARTKGIPSNGPGGKKTVPSAQDGKDMYGNPLLAPTREFSEDRSYYDPRRDRINLGEDSRTWADPGKLLAHENYHAKQWREGLSNYDIGQETDEAQWMRMQKRPNIASTDEIWNAFHNRKQIELQQDVDATKKAYPDLYFNIPNQIMVDRAIEGAQYKDPYSLEGEADYYGETGKDFRKEQYGGVIDDNMGQWAHPGEVTRINSNDITMKGVPYDVLGISDAGDKKLMKPGNNYKFKGKKVTELPVGKNGEKLRQEQKGMVNLDQLTNFTNYNTPQPGGWLDNL